MPNDGEANAAPVATASQGQAPGGMGSGQARAATIARPSTLAGGSAPGVDASALHAPPHGEAGLSQGQPVTPASRRRAHPRQPRAHASTTQPAPSSFVMTAEGLVPRSSVRGPSQASGVTNPGSSSGPANTASHVPDPQPRRSIARPSHDQPLRTSPVPPYPRGPIPIPRSARPRPPIDRETPYRPPTRSGRARQLVPSPISLLVTPPQRTQNTENARAALPVAPSGVNRLIHHPSLVQGTRQAFPSSAQRVGLGSTTQPPGNIGHPSCRLGQGPGYFTPAGFSSPASTQAPPFNATSGGYESSNHAAGNYGTPESYEFESNSGFQEHGSNDRRPQAFTPGAVSAYYAIFLCRRAVSLEWRGQRQPRIRRSRQAVEADRRNRTGSGGDGDGFVAVSF